MSSKRGLIEIRLDRRQAFYAVVGSLLIVSVIFVVGLIVGQRMQLDEPWAETPQGEEATAANGTSPRETGANGGAADEADEEAEDQYTFYDELAIERPSTMLLPSPTPITETPDLRVIERNAGADETPVADDAGDSERREDDAHEREHVAEAQTPVEEAPVVQEEEEEAEEQAPRIAAIDENAGSDNDDEDPSPGTRRVQRRTVSRTSSQEETQEQAQNEDNSGPADFGYYTVEAGRFSDFDEANALRDQLRSAGHSARVTIVSSSRNGREYRVQIGSFTRRADARELANEIQGSGFSASVVQEG